MQPDDNHRLMWCHQRIKELEQDYATVVGERDRLAAQLQRTRRVLRFAREYLESKDGPLYAAWDQGTIGNFDDRELTFEETIAAIEDGQDVLTDIVRVEAVEVYRQIIRRATGERVRRDSRRAGAAG